MSAGSGGGALRERRASSSGLAPAFLAVAMARVVSLTAGLVQLPFLARLLEPAQFAVVTAAIAGASYLSLVVTEPSALGFQRFPGSASQRDSYVYTRQRIGIWLLVAVVVAVVLGAVLGDLMLAFAVVGWSAALAAIRLDSVAWLMWQRPWSYAGALTLTTVLRTALLVMLVVLGVDAFAALGITGVVTACVTVLISPRAPLAAAVEKPWPVGFGGALAAASLVVAFMLNADRVLAPVLLGGEPAGSYAAMSQVAFLSLGAVLGLVNTALFPRVLELWNRGDRTVVARYTNRTIHLCMALTALFLIGGGTLGPVILRAAVGEEYVRTDLVLCLAAACCLYAIGQQASWSHKLSLSPRRIQRVAVGAALLHLGAIWALSTWLGARGMALGVLVGFVAYAVAMQHRADLGRRPVVLSILVALAGGASLVVSATGGAAVGVLLLVGAGTSYVLRPSAAPKAAAGGGR